MRSTFLAKALTACLLLAVVVAPAVAQDDPQNDGTKDGADVSNDETAANQDQEDMVANADAVGEEVLALAAVPGAPAQPVTAEANELGGKGGVDPATGETLLPLPEVSEFCKGTGQTPSDGTQNVGGSCSSVSQGQVPSQDKMVSTIIVEPENLAKIPLGSDFQVSVVTVNLKTGFFDVAATEYYTQPQTLDDQGVVKGHQHITVQRIADKTRPPNANEKQFFKGLNDAADGTGRLSVTVNATGITEPGLYRICSMTGTFAHQPVLMPVAQRGAQDDCIRIEIVDEGAGNGGSDDNGDGGNAENNDAGNGNAENNDDAGNDDAGNNDAGNNGAGNNDAGNNDAGNNDAGNNDAGNNDAGNNDAGNNDAGNNNGGNNNAAANGNAGNGGGNNGAPARAAATAGNAGNNNNNGAPARAAATAGNAGNNNNNGTPPRAAATAAGGNRNNNGTPPRAAATAGGNTGRGPRRAAVTAGNGRTNNRAPVRAAATAGRPSRAAATAAWPPSRAAATAAWPPSRAAATAGGAPTRAAATAGGANGAANNGGGAGGQGGRSAKEIIAEMLADLNTLEAEV